MDYLPPAEQHSPYEELKEDPRTWIQAADELREKSCSFKAITLYNHAIQLGLVQHQYSEVIQALINRSICWKHLFDKKKEPTFLLFAKSDCELIMSIIEKEKLNDQYYRGYFMLGKSYMMTKEYDKAVTHLIKAVELYPFDHAQKGHWMTNLGEAMYFSGKGEEGVNTILQAIDQIKKYEFQEDSFLYNVWLSGAYLKVSTLMINSGLSEGYKYFSLAKEMIEGDERLVIRRVHLKAVEELFLIDRAKGDSSGNMNSL